MAKVLVIAPSAYLLGGVQNWLDYLLPGLKAAGHAVTLGLVQGQWHRPAEYLAKHPWEPSIGIDNPTGSAMGRINAIVRTILSEDPDIVLSVNIGAVLEAMRIIRSRRQPRARLVMSIHAIEGDFFSELQYHGEVVDAVVVTNRLAVKLAREFAGVPDERLFYAPYGVDVPDTVADPRAVNTVLWMGRLEQPQKRVMELPDLAKYLGDNERPWCLRVAGDGPERQVLTDSLSDQDSVRIELMGHVEHERILTEVLPSSDVLLVNSTWETGPITIWEAMARGIPVVSSRYVGSGAEGSLRDGENALLFEVGDIAGAAARLEQLRSDPALRRKVISGGRELVGARYSHAASVQAWSSALDKVMDLPVNHSPGTQLPGPSGRLDRLLGVPRAEVVRRWLNFRFQHQAPGDEWPHVSLGMSPGEREDFMTRAAKLDLITSGPA